jgi:hypothetical protein
MEDRMSLVRLWGRRLALVVVAALPSAPAAADVIDFSNGPFPLQGTYLTSWGDGSIGYIADGTSNTIMIGETARVAVCFDGVSTGGTAVNPITDGTSNTIQFGEGRGLQVSIGRVLSRRSITQITDGTSNTIQIGEISSSSFCVDSIRPTATEIADGTSNTILIGEGSAIDLCVSDGGVNTCVEGMRIVGGDQAAVPEPATAVLLLGGVIVCALGRRRARSQLTM